MLRQYDGRSLAKNRIKNGLLTKFIEILRYPKLGPAKLGPVLALYEDVFLPYMKQLLILHFLFIVVSSTKDFICIFIFHGHNANSTCSALRTRYRDTLSENITPIVIFEKLAISVQRISMCGCSGGSKSVGSVGSFSAKFSLPRIPAPPQKNVPNPNQAFCVPRACCFKEDRHCELGLESGGPKVDCHHGGKLLIKMNLRSPFYHNPEFYNKR